MSSTELPPPPVMSSAPPPSPAFTATTVTPPSPPPTPVLASPPAGKSNAKRTALIAGVALLVGVGIGMSGNDGGRTVVTRTVTAPPPAAVAPAEDTSSQTFSPSQGDGADDSPSPSAPTFKNGVLTTTDVKIQITHYKIVKAGQKGNEFSKKPVIAFYYKTTNLSGEPVDSSDFLFNFSVYQDNNPNTENELDMGIGFEDGLDSGAEMERIKKGGTVEGAMAYELDDLTTPVDLVATDGVAGDVLGKATYKLR